MSTHRAKTLFLCTATGVGFLFLGGCGAADPAGEVTAEEAAQLFKSTKAALLQTVLGAKNQTRNVRSGFDIPLSFEMGCPTSGSIYCNGNVSADMDGLDLDFTAGANDCTVFDDISMDGALELSLTAAIAGMVVEGMVNGSLTFYVDTPITCDMDLEMYVDANLEPYFGGTFCGYSVDMLNQLI